MSVSRTLRVLVPAPVMLVAAMQPALSAQARELDRGVLILMQGSEVVGREEFVLRRGRGSAPLTGFTIVSTAWFPAERPLRSLDAVIELGPDSATVATRIEAGNGEPRRVLIGIGPRRLTVRSETSSGESAREYPARGPHVVVDDSLYAPHALPPSSAFEIIDVVTLDGRRSPEARLVDHGIEFADVGGSRQSLHHWSIEGGQHVRHLWYDEAGRLMKVEDPGRGTTAVRAIEGR